MCPELQDGYGYRGGPGASRERAMHMARLRREEPQQLLRRALVFGERGAPRPILIKPPYVGDVTVTGYGNSTQDKDGRIIFIMSDLRIQTSFEYELRRRLTERPGNEVMCFAPRLRDTHVVLTEVRAAAMHEYASRYVENYFPQSFAWQIRQLRLALEGRYKPPEHKTRKNLIDWITVTGPLEYRVQHSVELSAGFVEGQSGAEDIAGSNDLGCSGKANDDVGRGSP